MVEPIASDIYKKDETFVYKLDDSPLVNGKYKFIIYSDNEKKAYARGYWFYKKAYVKSKFVIMRDKGGDN